MDFHVTIGAEIISLFILAVIFLKIVLAKDSVKGTNSTKVFVTIVITSFVANAVDLLSWIIPGTSSLLIRNVINYLSIISPDILLVPFAYYVLVCISEKRKASRWLARVVLILAITNSVLSTIYMFMGVLFTFDNNGNFVPLEMYTFIGIAPVIVFVYVIVLAIVFWKDLEKTNAICLILYMVFPMITMVSEALFGGAEITIPCMSISILTMFLFIQSRRISDIQVREQILVDLSYKDSMTSMANRKAFEERVESVKTNETVCVVFCDVNGLKYTNDNFGHHAGDKLLINFSKIMVYHFGEKDAFRISGDEFVAVIPNTTKEDIGVKIEEFKVDVVTNGKIAAIGIASGAGKDILKVIREAEDDMYKEKHSYYEFEGSKYKRSR